MKEFSIEEKAKAYDEAKARMSAAYNSNRCTIGFMNEIFPELTESEDERIRKALIKLVKKAGEGYENVIDGVSIENAIAWLEKQGGQETLCDKCRKEHPSHSCQDITELGRCALEKQGGQKPVVETKLKIEKGKWYICISQFCNCIEGRVYKATSDSKIIDDFGTEYDMHSDAYKYFRPWTIQDAKDGDVLYESSTNTILMFRSQTCGWIKVYCDLWTNKISLHDPDSTDYGRVSEMVLKPATKEQRDILFQKMKEAGYEWDAENKELKKIEQEQVIDYPDNLPKDNWELVQEFVNKFGRIPKDEDELNALIKYVLKKQNPWSEEDKKMLDDIIEASTHHCYLNITDINWLKSLKDKVQPQPKQEWSEEDEYLLDETIKHLESLIRITKKQGSAYSDEIQYYQRDIDWLKSLRPQKWRPTEDQIMCLQDAISNYQHRGYKAETLESLCKQLKQL